MIKGEKYTKSGTITQTDDDGVVLHTETGIVIGRGDNKRVVTEESVADLAALHCDITEMADILGVKPDTLKRHFAEVITKAKALAKSQLRKAQWKNAMSGNTTMQIWLGKNVLGQSDAPLSDTNIEPLPWSDEVVRTGDPDE
tara:strand:+ start:56 stop:481 length:426 start_codon:yes stop_codon:yes gene_type:complete